jgi:hypothetical protein
MLLKNKSLSETHIRMLIPRLKQDELDILVYHPNLTLDIIRDTMGTVQWNWDNLSRNPNVTPAFVEEHIDKPWNWERLSWNLPLNNRFMARHAGENWDVRGLSWNPTLPMEYVIEHPELDWDISGISATSKWICHFLERFPDGLSNHNGKKHWRWHKLLTNKNLTLKHMEKYVMPHLSKGYDICQLKYAIINPAAFVEPSITHEFDFFQMSKIYVITEDYVRHNMHLPWDMEALSAHPNISMEFIDEFIDGVDELDPKEWNWAAVSRNPNLTPEFIQQHLDKPWDMLSLAQNKYSEHPYLKAKRKDQMESRNRTIERTQIIWEELMAVTWNPAIPRNQWRIYSEIIHSDD